MRDVGELWSDLRRWRGWRIVTGYLAGALATTLAVAELYEFVGLPDSAPRLVLVAVPAAFPVVLGVAWAVGRRGRGTAAEADPIDSPADERRSILVTPLLNGSPDAENEFIADGVTEEIITDLSRLSALRVIARPSAMKLKGGGEPLLDAARKLGVDFMLEGSVRRASDRLRVTVRLVEVRSEAALWSERFDGTFDEIFEIQAAVARSVGEHLEVEITPDELRALEENLLADPRAYESYMRARYETPALRRGGTAERLRRACLRARARVAARILAPGTGSIPGRGAPCRGRPAGQSAGQHARRPRRAAHARIYLRDPRPARPCPGASPTR